MIFLKIFSVTILLFYAFTALAIIKSPKAQTKKDTCLVNSKTLSNVSIYVSNIYDLKPNDDSFRITFYLTIDSIYKCIIDQAFEITNSKQTAFYNDYPGASKNAPSATYTVNATIIHNWNLERYPFDRQIFRVDIEPPLDTNSTIFAVNSKSLKCLDSCQIIAGWDFVKSYVKKDNVVFFSKFGVKKSDSTSTYSKVSFYIEAKRQGGAYFFKLLVGVFVAFFVAYSAFFFQTNDGQRFGICTAALFAAVANKYVSDSDIPNSVAFSYIDWVHIISFLAILAILLLSLNTYIIHKKDQIPKAHRLNKKGRNLTLIIYLTINSVLFFYAYCS